MPPNFFDNLRILTEYCALIHGTDTAWDGVHRIVIKVSNLRLTYGNAAVSAWLAAADRKLVTREQVVFDPTQRVDRRTHVNLFSGLEMRPRSGTCTKLLEVLHFLCNGDAAIVQWVLRWIALPLQRVGTKMATAILMHGAEGTGKNLFWGAVQSIYGRYATMIGQSQIESQFNGWLSAKLFVVGNEVLGRKEKWELKGALKHLVTEDCIYINEKNLPERLEHNHANLVFLSNEIQPLVLNRGDRRYLVVDCWREHPEGAAFYDAVRTELTAGGAEAFYAYLLGLPLDDFGPHTKPLDTEAKRDLVELGKDEPERFLEQWRDGVLELPYGAGAAEDLYAAFRRWCANQGERHVPTLNRFARTAKALLHSRKMRPNLRRRGSIDSRQKIVYWDEAVVPTDCADLDAWIKEQAQALADAIHDARPNDPSEDAG